MKVAIIYSHLQELGGAERVILKQMELFHKKGFQAECYFAYLDQKLRKESSNPYSYTKSFLASLIPNNPALRIILSVPLAPLTTHVFNRNNVLLCHGYGPAPWIGYLNKKLKGTPYISYIHSPPRFFYLSRESRNLWRFNDIREIIFKLSKLTSPILKEIDYLSVVNSDSILANSFFTAKRLYSIYGVKAKVCYPPVDTENFKILTKENIEEIRKKFSSPLILSTGRIVAIKRWEWLLKIMSYIVKENSSATLAITGKISKENSNYVQFLRKTAKKLKVDGNVRFLGFRSQGELVKLYNAADVYVYSVPNEDFGLGPVEAMACGTPAVVWNDGSGPCETVIEGENGFRAKPYNMEDFAEKTLKAIEMNKMEISEKIREFVKQNFSCEKHWKILRETIQSLINNENFN